MTSKANEDSYQLELTLEAQDDFRDIIQYTLETWGNVQALAYRDKLITALETLNYNPRLGHAREDILPHYRAYRIGEHIIIYWLHDQTISVIRILHGRMAPRRHLD